MSRHFDVMVIGLGANGSSAAYHLSKSGLNIGGIDQFRPPHERGSSHGQSRIIRQAYYENPLYVPLVRQAYHVWNDMQTISGKDLFLKTGGIMLGTKDAAVIKGSRLSAETHSIPYEYLDNREIKKRFPALNPDAETVGVLEKDAGILFPEACIQAFLTEAERNGAALRYHERVTEIKSDRNPIEIITDQDRYTADKLIVTAGAWMSSVMKELDLPLVVQRRVLYWFRNGKETSRMKFTPDRLPIYIWEDGDGKMFYGFPDLGDGIKIASHHWGRAVDPDALTNDVTTAEMAEMEALIADHLDIEPVFNYASVCMYTNTPDEDFIIDYHPSNANICVASPCSGHGFKFSSFTGKLLAEMALAQQLSADLSPFRIARFGNVVK